MSGPALSTLVPQCDPKGASSGGATLSQRSPIEKEPKRGDCLKQRKNPNRLVSLYKRRTPVIIIATAWMQSPMSTMRIRVQAGRGDESNLVYITYPSNSS